MVAYLQSFFSGIGLGLVLAILVGPVFFTLVHVSISRGFHSGIIFALGILTSDLSYFILTYLGISQVDQNDTVKLLLGIFGGAFLIIYGITLLAKRKVRIEFKRPDARSMAGFYIKGFLINALNPFVLIYWISVTGGLVIQYGDQTSKVVTFAIGCFLTVFLTDLTKSFLSFRLKRLIRESMLIWLNRVSGFLLVGFGIGLLYFTVVK